jgi:hypothetical protein
MPKIRVTLTILVATLALSAIGASATSAATAGWMANGSLFTGTKALAATARVDERPKLSAAGTTIECRSEIIHIEGELHSIIITPLWWILLHLLWLECVSITSTCTLGSSTIGTVPLGGELTLDGALADNLTLSPRTKTTLTTIEYIGASCALEGIQPVTGKAVYLLPTGQDEGASQLAKATSASSLKVGSSAATLEGSFLLKLASSEPWSFL